MPFRGRDGDDSGAFQLIRQEPAFVALREREELKQLLQGNSP